MTDILDDREWGRKVIPQRRTTWEKPRPHTHKHLLSQFSNGRTHLGREGSWGQDTLAETFILWATGSSWGLEQGNDVATNTLAWETLFLADIWEGLKWDWWQRPLPPWVSGGGTERKAWVWMLSWRNNYRTSIIRISGSVWEEKAHLENIKMKTACRDAWVAVG